MPFDVRQHTSGALMVGGDTVTLDDGLAVFELIAQNPGWSHVIVDVSASAFPVVLPREEELNGLHLLARTARDLGLSHGFRLALVRGPQSADRSADFVDLARVLITGLEVEAFDSQADACAWAEATPAN